MKNVTLFFALIFLCLQAKAQDEKIIANYSIQGDQLPIQKSILIEEPGIIFVEFDEISRNNEIIIEITPFLNKTPTINQARIDFPGKVNLVIKQANNKFLNESIKAKIKFLPIVDVFEPNDNFNQAASIGPLVWYQSMLFPSGDIDVFKIKLDKSYWIYPDNQNSILRVKWELFDENNLYLTDTFPYYAESGIYNFKLFSTNNESSKESIFFKLGIYDDFDELEPNDTIHSPLEIGKQYRVNFNTKNDIDLFSLHAKDNGYAIFKTSNIASSFVRFYYGNQYGNPLVISAIKGDTIKVKMVPHNNWFRTPFNVYSQIINGLDDNEPNDSIPVATELRRNQGLYFSLYPNLDEDWFQVTTTGESKFIVNIFNTLSSEGTVDLEDISLELYDSQRNFKYGLTPRKSSFGIIYSTKVIKEPGDWYLRAFLKKTLKFEKLYGIKIFGSNLDEKPINTDFNDAYFIGFELDSSTNLSIKSLVETTSAPYVMVDSTGSLEKTMSKVFEDARHQSNLKMWIYLILLISIVVGGYWIYNYRKK